MTAVTDAGTVRRDSAVFPPRAKGALAPPPICPFESGMTKFGGSKGVIIVKICRSIYTATAMVATVLGLGRPWWPQRPLSQANMKMRLPAS